MSLFGLVFACSSDPPAGNDPPGFSCEYDPLGIASYVIPTPEQLGEWDFFARVRVTGHRQHTPLSSIYNQVTVEDVVFGQIEEGDTLELQGEHRSCFETGESYYLLFNEPGNTGYSFVNGPWRSFPVINNRITLHPDMRKDGVIGRFHGLDPVLFKRQFIDYVGRDDIQVD